MWFHISKLPGRTSDKGGGQAMGNGSKCDYRRPPPKKNTNPGFNLFWPVTR